MSPVIPTRFSDDELALIDALVADGVAASRSTVIRRALHELASAQRRTRSGEAIAASYHDRPQTPEDDAQALANAIALTEAEPW